MNERWARPKAEEMPPLKGELCIKCGKKLMNIDVGLHKKMINRGAREYMCIDCLSEYIGVSTDELRRKAEEFKKMGCMLFY